MVPVPRELGMNTNRVEYIGHKPVMVHEVLNLLKNLDSGVLIDATFGSGGHSSEILTLYPKFHIVGIDRDLDSIESNPYDIELFHDNFSNIHEIVQENGLKDIRCVFFDFGISTHQIEEADRGFTFEENTTLDMRMDRTQDLTAKEFLNNASFEEIFTVIKNYGEERYSNRVANEIIKSRPIETSQELSKAIDHAVPIKNPINRKKSVRRCFQAIRIFVNDELKHIETGIRKSIDIVDQDGIIIAISYHSLEDKIVKKIFSDYSQVCLCPKEIPECICDNEPKLLFGKPKKILPKDSEIRKNRKSKSAVLRYAVKL